jgi:hypothetical protein
MAVSDVRPQRVRMVRRLRAIPVLLLAFLVPACSATHVVRPLPRGTSQWTVSLGGPWLPGAVPTKVVPYASIGLQRGVSDDLTLGGAVHATMAAYKVAAGELSAARRIAAGAGLRPELAATGNVYLFAGDGGARVFPALGGVASWRPGERTLLFGGAQVIGQFTGAPAALVTPLAGVQRRVRSRLGLQAEVKWMAANADTRAGVFEGESSIGGRGAFAVQLGVTIDRGRRK